MNQKIILIGAIIALMIAAGCYNENRTIAGENSFYNEN